jgi:hypothetical protein
MLVCDRRWREWSRFQDLFVNIQSLINPLGITQSVDQDVVGHDIGYDVVLAKEEMEESNGIIKTAMAKEGGGHSVASEDSGAGALLESVNSGKGGGGVEITGAEEGLDAVVKRETGAHEGRGGVGEAGIAGRWRIGWRSKSVERGFNAKAALAAAALGCSFLG